LHNPRAVRERLDHIGGVDARGRAVLVLVVAAHSPAGAVAVDSHADCVADQVIGHAGRTGDVEDVDGRVVAQVDHVIHADSSNLLVVERDPDIADCVYRDAPRVGNTVEIGAKPLLGHRFEDLDVAAVPTAEPDALRGVDDDAIAFRALVVVVGNAVDLRQRAAVGVDLGEVGGVAVVQAG
jgi:hypothetical protein